jgi:hypothetical protein
MPGKRPPTKGSFGSHLDELVKHFPHGHATERPAAGKSKKPKRKPRVSVHQALFERAAH